MIDRKKILSMAKDDETKALLSHAYDLYAKSEKVGRPFFSDFLSPLEAREISEAFSASVTFYGGYDDAERVMAVFGEAEGIDYPISSIEIVTKNSSPLSHQACLGTVLSLGLKRTGVGDIIIDGSRATVFCVSSLAEYIKDGLTKIGGTGVKTRVLDAKEVFVPKRQYKEKSVSLSSMRLDCVVSAAVGKSRAGASDFIKRAQVFVNHKAITSQSHTVTDGDVVTVRGEGKFLIRTENNLTRKGRIFVKILKYI